ncbi:MAG: mucoidy inhibitor MuiA family protein [Deltaproteobacteria bacterium]|nr:mucoidy inhibitor MuiA family protein [Deltaproteobacteria bacterium]
MTFWVLLASFAGAATHEVQAVPAEVVVYADRALTTRTVTLDLGTGEQEVVFTGLPARTLSDSVTADASGPGELFGIDLRRVTASQVADERVAELQDEIRALQDRRRIAKDQEAASTAELKALEGSRAESAKALSAQLLAGDDGPGRARRLRRSLAEQEAGARESLRESQRQVRDLNDQISALERERTQLGSSATDTWTATVRLDLARAGRVTVDLSYLVTGATWRPHYDLRGTADTGMVQLALSALVAQRTGEDWEDVKLTVSSAQPSRGTVVPTLDPFWLRRYTPPPRPSSRSSRAKAAAAPVAMAEESLDMDYAAEPEPQPMEVATAAVQVELSATAFSVSRPEDVAADGTERKVLLTTESLEAALRHVVVARIDPRAFLVGEVTNTAGFPLLPGEAGVFLDDAYLGDFMLNAVAPGDEFDIAFGVDDRVTVKRKPEDIVIDDEKLGGKRAVSRWRWKVEVKNGHRRPISVEVLEQVPQSTHDDVRVSWDVAEGGPQPEEEDGGILKFPYDLGAGAERIFEWGYEVNYPTDLYLGWME